ncbi:MAG: hypothetical protein WBW62_09675 [Solirubrobacterales bacterium]
MGGLVLALAAVLTVAFVPLYSSGATIVQQNGSLPLFVAFAVAVLVAVPLLLPEPAAGRFAMYGGIAIALTSFVTVLGLFFLPAALLLVYSGAVGRRRPLS